MKILRAENEALWASARMGVASAPPASSGDVTGILLQHIGILIDEKLQTGLAEMRRELAPRGGRPAVPPSAVHAPSSVTEKGSEEREEGYRAKTPQPSTFGARIPPPGSSRLTR